MTHKLLHGHVSEETAYTVNNYPYGFRRRTKIRYWIETNGKKGDRFCKQTLNPKSHKWNKPKRSTYSTAMQMFLNKDSHVKYMGVSAYSEQETIEKFVERVGADNLSDTQKENIKVVLAGKEALKHFTFECKPVRNQQERDEAKENEKKFADDFKKIASIKYMNITI